MPRSTWLTDILLLTLITSLFFGAFLGTRNLSAPDELRYSEIPREMIVNHDYVVPRINGVKYFEKPPLFYWMQVACIKTFGLNEWSLRLTTALMGLFGVLATYLFSRRLYDRKTGWLSALILSSMTLYFGMAHIITLDMTVSVFITLSIYSFYLATQAKSKNVKYYMWGAFVAAACAMMTKGLIGIIFPAMIAGLWVLVFHRWRQLKHLHLVSSVLIFMVLVAPWHILVELKAPEFFNFYFIDQQFLRYATLSANRYQSPLFYIPVIILGTLPWLCFLPQALSFLKKARWNNRAQYEKDLFLISWFLFIFVFYSFSNSKLIPYVLPILPPLAIVIARYFALLTVHTQGLKRGYIVLSSVYMICTLIITFLQISPHYALSAHITYLNLSCLAMALAGIYGLKQRAHLLKPFIAVYLSANLLLVSAIVSIDYFDNHTVKSLALYVKQHIQPSDEVIAYHGYHQDLPFYLQRVVTVNESFDELSFGAANGDTQQWMIHEPEFEKRWKSNAMIYLFITKRKYQEFMQTYPQSKGWVVAESGNNLVVVNHLNASLHQDLP